MMSSSLDSPTAAGAASSGGLQSRQRHADSSSLHTGTEQIDIQELTQLLVRQRISNMFRRYVPTKLHRPDIALLRYHGKEDALLRSLVAKFGPEPSFTVEQQKLSDVISERNAARSSNKRSHHTTFAGSSDYVDPSHADGDDEGSTLEPQRCSASPRAITGTSNTNNGDFQAAVALVAHHHQLRTRLFETFSAKRTILRMQEEKDRDHLYKMMMMDQRHVMSQQHRKQAESILFVQRERSLLVEQQVAARRQEEAKVAWLQAQAASWFQRTSAKREEVSAMERQERRLLHQQYFEERAKQFRHEKRVARLRDAAETEAAQHMRFSNNSLDDNNRTPSGSATPTTHRRRLEDALSESPLDAIFGKSQRSTPPPSSSTTLPQKRNTKWTSPEACDELLGDLMSRLGTAVTSSTSHYGLMLPSIATPQPKGQSKPPSNASSPLLRISGSVAGGNHWAVEPVVLDSVTTTHRQQQQSTMVVMNSLPAVHNNATSGSGVTAAAHGSMSIGEQRKRRRRKHKKGGSQSSRSRSSRAEGE